MQCLKLAEAGYYEARGESDEGVAAVMYVIINRVNHKKWPGTIAKVIHQKSQFSYTFDGSLDKPMEKAQKDRMRLLAWEVIHGTIPNPVGLANHYHSKSSKPFWKRKMKFVTQIGNHLFYQL